MRETLSIRTYNPVIASHSHRFHQIVFPLNGTIEISLNGTNGSVSTGHCVIIQKNVQHSFIAKKEARFLVADLYDLPESAKSIESPFAAVSSAFRSFCMFADIQLNSNHDQRIEDSMIRVFKNLLALQDFLPEIDRRISRALEYIENDISEAHSLDNLAAVSSLSVSQFKVQFTKHTGKTVGQYLLTLRMEKARALLVNTDMPIAIIAACTGYSDQSAFTRRFQKYYGVPPSQFTKRSEK
ncbi:hypothetical protein AB833_00605 [Chromatiales bacterium (ex Bugula neritina AB1)]|nr:hypothetical protein AB833_00605 [Chromatiales bacterium (ex Bugula neritina AB1)]